MPTVSKNPIYLFDLVPTSETNQTNLPDFGACSIEEAIAFLSTVGSWAEIESALIASAIRKDGHDILRSLFLDGLKTLKHHQMENCSSMSNYCATRAGGSFAISASTLSDDLKCASVLRTLAYSPFAEDIAAYLAQIGRSQELEPEILFARPLSFKVADFFGHKSKLRLLDRLMKAGHKKIDWTRFFESTVDDYEAFVRELLFSRKDPFAKSFLSTRRAAENWPGSEQAFAETTQLEAPEATQDEETLIDPFSPRDNSTGPSIPVRFQAELKLKLHCTGTLAGSLIYKDTRLAVDDGYLDRANKFLGEIA
jgi:hypothetical protein